MGRSGPGGNGPERPEWVASMTIRKLAAHLPLAVLVGAVVHVAAAGGDHAPGGHNSFALLASLSVALVLALGSAFFGGVLGTFRRSIATRRDLVYGTLALALAGTGSYALIELLEGHVGSGGALRALAASFPVAALVVALSRKAARVAEAAGSRFAAWRPRNSGHRTVTRVAAQRRRRFAYRRLGAETRRGRAPPVFV